MKLYLSGKISGDPDYKKKFEHFENIFAGAGHSVMNPARIKMYDAFKWEDYMVVSAAMQSLCEAIVLLPDWMESRGARCEANAAHNLKQQIFFLKKEGNCIWCRKMNIGS